MTVIVGLVILGVMLIGFEVFVPGGILGAFGVFGLIGAIILAYKEFGGLGALATFFVSSILVFLVLVIELKLLPKTKLGKRVFLNQSVTAKSTAPSADESLIGKTGTVLSELAPSGRVAVEGKQFEAFSQDGLIKAGESVKVVAKDNFRIVVTQIQTEEEQ